MKYDVRLGLDASLWVSVEAASIEEAKDKAFEKLTESNLGDLSMVRVLDYRIYRVDDVPEPPKEEP